MNSWALVISELRKGIDNIPKPAIAINTIPTIKANVFISLKLLFVS